MKYYLTILLFLVTNVSFGSENKLVTYKNICNEPWIYKTLEDRNETNNSIPDIKEVCFKVFNETIDNHEVDNLVKLSNSSNITAWFLLGYYIFEYDHTETKETEMALNLIKKSAFRSNPYADAYLYEIYSTNKYGIKNDIEAALSLTHFSNYKQKPNK